MAQGKDLGQAFRSCRTAVDMALPEFPHQSMYILREGQPSRVDVQTRTISPGSYYLDPNTRISKTKKIRILAGYATQSVRMKRPNSQAKVLFLNLIQ